MRMLPKWCYGSMVATAAFPPSFFPMGLFLLNPVPASLPPSSRSNLISAWREYCFPLSQYFSSISTILPELFVLAGFLLASYLREQASNGSVHFPMARFVTLMNRIQQRLELFTLHI